MQGERCTEDGAHDKLTLVVNIFGYGTYNKAWKPVFKNLKRKKRSIFLTGKDSVRYATSCLRTPKGECRESSCPAEGDFTGEEATCLSN